MKLLLAALLLGTPLAPPVLARAAIVAPASDADRLVEALLPEPALVAITGKLFDNTVQNEANLTPEKKALYAANPGLKAHLSTAMRGELASALHKDLPTLRTDLAALLSREMAAEEISQTLAFFASPTGKKMMAHMYDGVANSSAASEAEAQQAAMAGLMASLTAEDYPALMAFGATPAATKLQAVTPQVHALTKSWAAKMMVDNEARMKAAVDKATADYLAKNK
jgi:hypothetical protein